MSLEHLTESVNSVRHWDGPAGFIGRVKRARLFGGLNSTRERRGVRPDAERRDERSAKGFASHRTAKSRPPSGETAARSRVEGARVSLLGRFFTIACGDGERLPPVPVRRRPQRETRRLGDRGNLVNSKSIAWSIGAPLKTIRTLVAAESGPWMLKAEYGTTCVPGMIISGILAWPWPCRRRWSR